jgi:succinoglycan biosynthesis protein ExoA
MMTRSTHPSNLMPSVSIITPCFNEQDTICKLLEAIYKQSYPRRELEVVIADGMSTDHTRAEITAFSGTHPDLHINVVDNPRRIIPAGLNFALAEARGEIIIRLDGHSMPYPDYIEQTVSDLESGLGDNVGGVWEIHPGAETWLAKSIAAAASHPLGVGDAHYRYAEKAAEVDTVPFGGFKRELLALIGLFDEALLTNEDYEFNTRVRKSGHKVWLDPSIRSVYFSRPTLSSLAKQYARYGYWKWRMVRRYPDTLRWRQGLPPLFVLSIIAGASLAFFSSFFRILFAGELLVYVFTLLAAGVAAAIHQKKTYLIIGLPLSIATMHFSWGAGFLWSIIKLVSTERKAKES